MGSVYIMNVEDKCLGVLIPTLFIFRSQVSESPFDCEAGRKTLSGDRQLPRAGSVLFMQM